MTNREESSYDLERAREVSRRLRPAGPATPAPAATPAAESSRPAFSADRARHFGEGPVRPAAPPAPAVGAAAAPRRAASPPPAPAPPPPQVPPPLHAAAVTTAPLTSAPRSSAPAPSQPAAMRPDAMPPSPRHPSPPPPASGSWESLLAWSRTALAADAAFVIDELGLLVANSGKLSDDEAQAMGARLVVAVDHADDLERGSPVRTIAFDLSTYNLTGIRLPLEQGTRLTVGVVSLRPLSASAGALVRKAFASKVGAG